MKEPLSAEVATALIHEIARNGDVAWSQHATDALVGRTLSTVDCVNVMRCGAVTTPPSLEHDTWRYRVQTNRICVVVGFRSETELVVVTAWRIKR